MIKRFLLLSFLLGLYVTAGYLIILQGVVKPVMATQCLEPGCCGYYLRWYQWQCIETGADTGRCAALGEPLHYFCPTDGTDWTTADECFFHCPVTCGTACHSDWASECVIEHHDEPCVNPDPNTCTASYAAIQCSEQQGANACVGSTAPLDTRGCWVLGAPSPTPTPGVDPSPTPNPGDCDGNWYGCTGATTCARFDTQALCQAGASQCACGECACQTDKGKIAFTFFEDLNQNGVWDFDQNERRIQPDNSCPVDGSFVVSGVQLWFDSSQLTPTCNVLNTEFEGTTCTGSQSCGANTCNSWGPEWQAYGDTCFAEPEYCSACNAGGINCIPGTIEQGLVCSQPPFVYCDPYVGPNMRNGYVYIKQSQTGARNVQVVTPPGWFVSPGTHGGSNNFTVNVTTNYNRIRCEAGLQVIGLVRDYNKQCTVNLFRDSIPSDESTLATVWALSGKPGADPVNLVIGKSDYSQILDENNQLYVPPGTTHYEISGKHYYIWHPPIDLINGSFETGTTANWTGGGALSATGFAVIDSNMYPADGLDGRFYLKMQRGSAGDAYVVSDWIDVGRQLGGQSFTLNLMIRGQNNSGTQTVSNISLQADDNYQAFIGNVTTIPTSWTTYTRTVTFPANNAQTKMRVVLRVPDSTAAVYYDGISVENADGEGGCTTGDNVACQSDTVISGLPVGDYKLHCEVPTAPQGCSGNPNCIYEGGSLSCPGLESCSLQDNADLEVTCSPQCGQTGCNFDDSGIPNPSNIQPPTQNMTTNPSNPLITWSESSTLTDYWTLIIYNSGLQYTNAQLNAIAEDCGNYTGSTSQPLCRQISYGAFDTNHDGTLDLQPSYLYDPHILKKNNLRIALRGVNDTCYGYGGNQNSPWIHSTLLLTANVTGTIYDGEGTQGVTLCTGFQNPVSFPPTTTRIVSAASGGIPDSSSLSTYTIFNVPYLPDLSWGTGTDIILDINNSDSNNSWACNCPANGDPYSCRYTNILTPSTGPNVNFWVQQELAIDLDNGPWWQTWGGMVYAASGSVISRIPQPCIDDSTGYCRSFIVAKDIDQTTDSAGIPMSGSGVFSSGDTSGYYTDRATQQVAEGTYHDQLTQENYDYFIREILISEYTDTVPASVETSSDIFDTDFTIDADDNTRIYYAAGDVTIDPTATISTSDLPAGVDKALVLINGNLTVRDSDDIEQVINVDDGDFLGFIVNGNITFEASVGFDKTMTNLVPVDANANVEGLFVADGSLIVDGYDALGQLQLSDRKFIGAGTFVGFSGVALNRDFENSVDPLTRSINNLDPVSTFVYRPDLVESLPRFMHTPGLVWQEVN